MPKSAIGNAAITQISTPYTTPGITVVPMTPIRPAMTYASASPKKPKITSFFLPNFLTSLETNG